MAEASYRVVLQGYAPGKGEYYIEMDFAKLFKIEHEKAKQLFNSLPATIKEDLTIDQANKYKAAIEKTGAICEVENMKFNFKGLSLE